MLADSPKSSYRVPLVAFVVTATLFSLLALRNHANLKTCGFDLGIFMQEVKGYARFQAPIASSGEK